MSAAAATAGEIHVPVAEWRPRVNPWWIAAAVMLATFMEVLDTSIASVALPYIAGNLGASRDEATWVLTSYLVSNAIVLPVSAWFSNYFGRKRFLIGCIIIFTLSSFACGAATNLGMLILARVIQGAGGGALQPLAQAILLESFPPAKRGVAMAVYGLGVICAPIIGPTLGGWLTDSYSWRWSFYINIPVGALAVFLISMFVEDPPYIRNAKRTRFDAIGFGLLSIWLATLQIILDKGQQDDWFGALWIRWFAAISVISMFTFVWRSLSTSSPIVDLHVLKNRNFAIGCLLFGMFGACLYALITLQPLFLQTLLGYTALDSGLTVSPRGLGAVVALFLVGALVQKVNPRFLVAFGFLIFGIASFLFSRFTLDVSMRNIVPANVLNGFGTGFIFVPLTGLALGTLTNEQIGSGTGIQNLARNIGGGIGISFVSTMLERFAQAHQVFMVGQVTPLNPLYQQRLLAAQHVYSASYGVPDALQRAQASIYNLVLQQADYWAFMQLFYVIAWVCGISIVGVLLLKNVKGGRPVAVH
ncbi:MAG TPA: DHA2 family efflux MFS transporter permease subunit [Verrucomicrobiae bacterium]|jgi:DHA2 family multidrug resistance protein|nr:DHA2 family efflux MFS transporter permease subunit [Verrucomicrobiae bacterium]